MANPTTDPDVVYNEQFRYYYYNSNHIISKPETVVQTQEEALTDVNSAIANLEPGDHLTYSIQRELVNTNTNEIYIISFLGDEGEKTTIDTISPNDSKINLLELGR